MRDVLFSCETITPLCACSVTYVQLFATPWTVACQAPLSMGLSWQEYWSGFSLPPPGDLPDVGIKPTSPVLAGGFFTAEPPGKSPNHSCLSVKSPWFQEYPVGFEVEAGPEVYSV